MSKIHVLIVDDAAVVRRMVSEVLAGDPTLEVAGVAPNGRIALAKIPQLNPDIIILDVEMPEMDGLEALAEIRKLYPRLPVIMFSTLTERGATATLTALELGAKDYVTKPSNVGGISLAIQSMREELIPKIKALCGKPSTLQAPFAPARVAEAKSGKLNEASLNRRSAGGSAAPVEVVAIGVSTGGPSALEAVLPLLPVDFPVPIVIVQHMPPVFTKNLSERLNHKSAIRVSEGVAGEAIQPGQAYIAPGGHHMILERKGTKILLQMHDEMPENSCRPAVDVLFRSVADVYGAGTLAVILTGMGQDGLRGCERIHAAGGQILAQDEASSVVWGMPGFVARAGLAEKLVALQQMAPTILRQVQKTQRLPALAQEIR